MIRWRIISGRLIHIPRTIRFRKDRQWNDWRIYEKTAMGLVRHGQGVYKDKESAVQYYCRSVVKKEIREETEPLRKRIVALELELHKISEFNNGLISVLDHQRAA